MWMYYGEEIWIILIIPPLIISVAAPNNLPFVAAPKSPKGDLKSGMRDFTGYTYRF